MIHILLYGRALCGLNGTPDQWPASELWVSLEHKDAATCRTCQQEAVTRLQRQVPPRG